MGPMNQQRAMVASFLVLGLIMGVLIVVNLTAFYAFGVIGSALALAANGVLRLRGVTPRYPKRDVDDQPRPR